MPDPRDGDFVCPCGTQLNEDDSLCWRCGGPKERFVDKRAPAKTHAKNIDELVKQIYGDTSGA